MTAQAALKQAQEDQRPDFSPLRILIVDDAQAIRSYVRQILEKMGFQNLEEAEDGEDALDKVSAFNPDLVLLDIKMEPMNGLEFLKAIRSGCTTVRRDLPVVVLTVASDEAVLGTALALDCDAFLTKPASMTEIGERIWRITSAKPSVRPAEAYKVIPIPDLYGDRADTAPEQPHDAQALTEEVLAITVGTVLDADIRTASGNLLLALGTVLTQKYAERLSEIAQTTDLMLISGEEG